MAKKKAASTNGKKTTSSLKSAPAKKKSKPAKTVPTFSSEEIGFTAGQIWQVLADGGDQTPTALKKSVDAPADLVMAAVGWLAREEKLVFDASGRSVRVALK